ncbi:YqjD family protein [Pseudomonas sp. LS44]|uniref:DUF883 family protein n=1 Tax=Pseudomonas sp. LS44 TaxID=1357074 RepID=UPI00215B0599|nr:YqjD family protein [Pseudomonas sp. LS44]UVE16436.1 YqjD family protein [Pseudomonas sp. LS44]
MARKNTTSGVDPLLAEFEALVNDTERLLNETASVAGDEAAELRNQMKEGLQRARETLGFAEDRIRERGQAAVDATELYVVEHPWQALGMAAAVGVIVGLLVGRR